MEKKISGVWDGSLFQIPKERKVRNMQIIECIERVGKKYGYDAELIDALKRCVPAMIDGKTEKNIRLLMDTLERVQIYTFNDKPNQGEIDNITKQKLRGRNTHVKQISYDKGEYEKSNRQGGYVNQPVFDEKMNIIDRVGFIYITNLNDNGETAKCYGTKINLSHLMHELGHAWGAQKGEYVQEENGDYTMSIGTYRIHIKVNRDTHTIEEVGTEGLYVEEALNSIEEEKALYKMLEISEYRKIPGYVPSTYQGRMTELMRRYIEKLGEEAFEELRIQKNREKLDKLQELFDNTDFMKKIKESDYYPNKKKIFESIQGTSASDEVKKEIENFFDKYRKLYFEPHQTNGFLEHLDIVMEQLYVFASIKYRYDISKADIDEVFQKTLVAILKEGYSPVNQVADIIEKRNMQDNSPVTLSKLAEQALQENNIRAGEMLNVEQEYTSDKNYKTGEEI